MIDELDRLLETLELLDDVCEWALHGDAGLRPWSQEQLRAKLREVRTLGRQATSEALDLRLLAEVDGGRREQAAEPDVGPAHPGAGEPEPAADGPVHAGAAASG